MICASQRLTACRTDMLVWMIQLVIDFNQLSHHPPRGGCCIVGLLSLANHFGAKTGELWLYILLRLGEVRLRLLIQTINLSRLDVLRCRLIARNVPLETRDLLCVRAKLSLRLLPLSIDFPSSLLPLVDRVEHRDLLVYVYRIQRLGRPGQFAQPV